MTKVCKADAVVGINAAQVGKGKLGLVVLGPLDGHEVVGHDDVASIVLLATYAQVGATGKP